MAAERASAMQARSAMGSHTWDELAAQLRDYGARRGPALAAAVLGLAIVVQLVQFGMDAREEFFPPRHSAVARRVDPRNYTTDVARIASAHLFGEAPKPAAASPAETTVTNLVLAGVIASDDPVRGMGILGPSALVTRLYKVGDALPGGARLHGVYRDHVEFERDGALEMLYLPKGAPVGSDAGAALAARQRLAAAQMVADTSAPAVAEVQPQASASPSQRRAAVARAHEAWVQRNSSN